MGTKSCGQNWPQSAGKAGCVAALSQIDSKHQRAATTLSLLPHAHCRSASYLDEEGDDESRFPFVLMANNLENSPCLLRTVNDASEITSEIVIKENGRRERHTHTHTHTHRA